MLYFLKKFCDEFSAYGENHGGTRFLELMLNRNLREFVVGFVEKKSKIVSRVFLVELS